MKTLNLIAILLLFPLLSFGQCFNSGGIGSFEDPVPYTDWFTASQGNATFDMEASDVWNGTMSAKVDVTAPSTWQVRMFNATSCYFEAVAGEAFEITFSAKGPIGSDIRLTLMDNLTDDVTLNVPLTSSDWETYTVSLTPTFTSSSTRLKLNFFDVGTYLLDDLTVKKQSNNWYVSPTGTNSLAGGNGTDPSMPLQTIGYAANTAWQPGDTVFVMNGTYQNTNYGTGNLNNGAVVSLNISNGTGQEDGWLIIRNYPGHTPKLQFDGSGGFIGTAEYLEISGFEIEGPNQNITQAEADANRLIQDNYFGGRGIAIWNGHHIYIHDIKVHDCPNSGIRINNGDYCNVSYNEVYNNTWWSSNAESAIVFAQSQDIDTKDTIKMVITNNLVYDNYNTIPYYNSTYPTNGPSDYGTPAQDYIIDGSGCYITRNKDTYFYGWYYFANNVCYGNGINGLVVHKSDRAIVLNNTSYLNGSVPLSEGRQASSGITINSSNNVHMYNNISWARYASDYGYQIYNNTATDTLYAANNILGYGLSAFNASQYVFTDPEFVDTANRDFHLQATSPAINAGYVHPNLPPIDFDQIMRNDGMPDIGAFEFVPCLQTDTLIELTACDSLLSPNGGDIWTISGMYMDTLLNVSGCDSVITFDVTIENSVVTSLSATSCDSYTSPSGSVWTMSGLYNDTLQTISGCDSILVVDLTIHNSVVTSLSATSCDSYTSPSGSVWTMSGLYNDTLQTVSGCDSILVIDLTIENSVVTSLSATSCDSYTSPSGSVWTMSGLYNDTLQTISGCDSVLVIDLTIHNSVVTSLSATSCDSYTSPSGSFWTMSGLYNDTLQTVSGCDSILVIDLTIVTIDTTVTEQSGSLMANSQNGNYQWFDCTNQTEVVGETNATFTPEVTGEYAVIIDYMNCSDTSSCYSISVSGITNHDPLILAVYPNPSMNFVFVSGDIHNTEGFILLDAFGKKVSDALVWEQLEENTYKLDISAYSDGIYFLKKRDQNIRIQKIGSK